ncbi:MAG: hypothetical protein V2G33_08115 [bacterium JZ-2024 1]
MKWRVALVALMVLCGGMGLGRQGWAFSGPEEKPADTSSRQEVDIKESGSVSKGPYYACTALPIISSEENITEETGKSGEVGASTIPEEDIVCESRSYPCADPAKKQCGFSQQSSTCSPDGNECRGMYCLPPPGGSCPSCPCMEINSFYYKIRLIEEEHYTCICYDENNNNCNPPPNCGRWRRYHYVPVEYTFRACACSKEEITEYRWPMMQTEYTCYNCCEKEECKWCSDWEICSDCSVDPEGGGPRMLPFGRIIEKCAVLTCL